MTRRVRNFTSTALIAFVVTSSAILIFKPALARAAIAGPPAYIAPEKDSGPDERQSASDESQSNDESADGEKDRDERRKTVAVDPIRSLEQRGSPGGFGLLGIAGATFAPRSPFSNKLKANDFKQVEVSYDQGRFFAGTLNGIGFRFLNTANYSAEIAVDDDADTQIAKIDGDYRIFGPFVVSAGANIGLSDRFGDTFDFGLGIEQPLTTRLEVSLSGEVTYADGKHVRTLARQLTDAGLPPPDFKTGAGFESYSISATVSYELTDSLTLIAAGGGGGPLGDSRRLINQIDRAKKFQPIGLLVLAFSF